MTDDEFRSKMEFILDQQAEFAAKIGQLEDIVTRLANGSLKRFDEIEEKTAERRKDTDEKIAALVDSQIRSVERLDSIDVKLEALIDSQIKSGERLNSVDERIATLVDSQIKITNRLDDIDERFAALIDSQIKSTERLDNMSEKISTLTDAQIRLSESQALTDASLRNLITVVDRYFARRNGETQE